MSRLRRPVLAMILGVAMVLGLSACTSRAGEWTDQTYAIAGGGTTGVYSEYGKHLAEELSDALGIDVIGEETNGSVDNLLRVAEGEALLGFAQGDAAADAVAGVGAFALNGRMIDKPILSRAQALLERREMIERKIEARGNN